MDALEKRRSIRKYKPEVPSEETIRQVVEAATLAPSACNLQVAEFIYVSDPELMKRLAEVATGKVRWAPACLIGIYDSRFVRERGAHLQSLSAAVENMLLKAAELDLGTCWMAGFTGDDAIRELLAVPSHFEIACIVLIGRPDEAPPRPYKSPVEQILHINKYEPRRPHLNLSIDPSHWSPEEVAEYRRRIFSVYNRRLELGFLSEAQADRLWQEATNALTPHFPRDATVLDLHGWDLRIAGRLMETFRGCVARMVVADPIEENRRVVQETCPDYHTAAVADDYAIDVEDESVDLALLVNKIEFEPRPDRMMAALMPKLKKGGKVLLVAMARGSLYHRLIRLRFALVRIRDVYERSPFYKLGPFAFPRAAQLDELMGRHGLVPKLTRAIDIGLWAEEAAQNPRRGRAAGVLRFLVETLPAKSKECLLVLAEKT